MLHSVNSTKALRIYWLIIISKHIDLPMELAQVCKSFKETALA